MEATRALARSTYQSIDTTLSAFFSASHAARCVAFHGVRSHPVLVALVGECSMPVV
jgi:hypothetical protein